MVSWRKADSLAGRLEKHYIPEPMSGCWLWIGMAATGGYGLLKYEGRRLRAHAVSYEIHNGPIPVGLYVCHRCDVPSCVNPDHLFVGTQGDNMRDAKIKGRIARGERVGASKLTEQKVIAIRHAAGSKRATAREFGVSDKTVRNIKTRRSWAWL